MKLGTRIRVARRRAGISQVDLAAQVGVGRSAVANWESAQSQTAPSAERLQGIAMATGVSYEWLATGRGRATPQDSDIPAADLELVDDPVERALLEGFRSASERIRQAMLVIAEEQLPTRRSKS